MTNGAETDNHKRISLAMSPRGVQSATVSYLDSGPSSVLMDRFGRIHNNLRISVTDRCNLRCIYCMSEDVAFHPRSELLTYEEITAFVQVAARLGVNKLRLTGGEPLLRRDLPELVRMLVAIPGIVDVSLTTNGLLLQQAAEPLWKAGLRRLNVSLDSLDADRFQRLSRRDGVDQVIAGVLAAHAVGFQPIKINAVAIRSFIEQDAIPLARFCRQHGFELRFIEYMPIGAESWQRDQVVSAAELRDWLSREVDPLIPIPPSDPHAPATEFQYRDGGGRVGFIASVTAPFCDSCNRIRLTAEGKLRNCLFALTEWDVKPLLRPQVNPDEIASTLHQCVGAKWAGHGFNSAGYIKPDRTMHAIGG